jgi:hypothetical protein
MFETYRMLGAQREAELLAEAERLHRGRRFRRSDTPGRVARFARRLRPRRGEAEVLARPDVVN